MLFDNFLNRLQKLNPRLFVKNEQMARAGAEEYKITGLYLHDSKGSHEFIMAIPRNEVPEYSIAGVDFHALAMMGEWDKIEEIKRTGYALEDEKIIMRGWKAIVHGLIRRGFIDRVKANKLFNFHFEENRQDYPRNYINLKVY